MFGITIGEQRYDLVEFVRRRTGFDEVAADKLDLTGIARMCYFAGRQISKVAIACATCDGAGVWEEHNCSECNGAGFVGSAIDGPLELEHFGVMDGIDIQTLGGAAELWRQSFRLRGGKLSGQGARADGAAAGDENRMVGVSDSLAAGGAA